MTTLTSWLAVTSPVTCHVVMSTGQPHLPGQCSGQRCVGHAYRRLGWTADMLPRYLNY